MASRLLKLCGVLAVAAGAIWFPAAASADYEQVPEHFAEGWESVEALGTAVNESGEGGVPAGSIYVVGKQNRVTRFAPGEEGEAPRFEEAWGWGIAVGGPENEYVRCGPAYEGSASATDHTYENCKSTVSGGFGGEEVGNFANPSAIAINQANGYVYVRNIFQLGAVRKHNLIEVFKATGVPVGEGFGDVGDQSSTPPESIEAGPENLHQMAKSTVSIAVDETGRVYLNDVDFSSVEPAQARVMSFAPATPGDYEHYVYTGRSEDIAIPYVQNLERIALVGSDRLVGARSNLVSEYPLEAGSHPPLCSLPVSGQLRGMAANRLTGEVFYSTFADRSIHRLGACEEGTGSFEEIQKLKPTPEVKNVYAMAVNSAGAWGPERPAGILYAVDGGTGSGATAIGDVFAPAKALRPLIESESAANTTTSSTTLEARIDPRGTPTEYSFQYLPAATYQSLLAAAEGEGKSPAEAEDAAFAAGTVAPPTPGEIASGALVTATAPLSGLAPDTAYVFRALAQSSCNAEEPQEVCEAAGAPASFSTYPKAPGGLPDSRAYELVSPAQKHGGEAFPADPSIYSCDFSCKPPGTSSESTFPMQAASDGEGVAYEGFPFSSTEGAAVSNSYISRRTAFGWRTTAMSPALLKTKGGLNLSYGAALGAGAVYQPRSGAALAPGAPQGYAEIYFQSADDPSSLIPTVVSQSPHRTDKGFILEYGGTTGDASRQYFAANDALIGEVPGVGVPPDPTSGGSNPDGRDLYEWRDGQLTLINVMPDGATIAVSPSFASLSPDTHAVAADGRRVFFQAGGHLYVREDGQVTREVTHPGNFLAASADGLRVLLSDGCLYSLASETCADLTEGEGGFAGVAGHSQDLSHVYFVGTAALPGAGENERHQLPQAGKPNLYGYRTGDGVRFIATLNAADNTGVVFNLEDWNASPAKRTAEASPSGRFLAFGSTRSLTGYDNTGPCEEVPGPNGPETVLAPCAEIFLYDSATGALTCPSCNPTGEGPRGPSTLRRIEGAKGWQPQPRYLTDSGRLYFDSQDRLSPRDSNGKVEDVYEAEPSGVGSCARAAGCVTLISPGTGSVDSNFLSMGETGKDVFFTSRERLVATDTDELIDVYDAREGGGFPSETETQRAECQGESCQPVAQAPNDPTPSSSAFHGAGNVREGAAKPTRCPKGKVRKHGRCVKKAHSKRHKKHKRQQRANRDRRNHR